MRCFNTRQRIVFALVLSCVCLGTGCTSTQEKTGVPATPSAEGGMPAPERRMSFDFTEEVAGADSAALETSAPDVKEQQYRLGIGDVLEISLYGAGLQRSRREVAIDPSGKISYMVVGRMKAAGLTVDELRQKLQQRLSEKYNYTIINVVPVRFASRSYTVQGQVSKPGRYLLQGRTTLLEAICRAGGFKVGRYKGSTRDLHDLKHAVLIRKGEILPVDFEKLILQGDARQNVLMQDGDIVNIPSALQKKIYVLGEVRRPRTVGSYGALTLLGALAESGGRTEQASERVVIIRGKLASPEANVYNLNDIFAGEARDIPLAPDDIVYVPPRNFRFLRKLVRGAVRNFAVSLAADTADELSDDDDDDDNRPIILP